MRLDGVEFENGSTCRGVGFAVKDLPLDIAYVSIHGRYPEKGWASNELIHEMAWVEKGEGNLLIKDNAPLPLQKGDAVVVKPGEQFAWQGELDIVIACSPPFDKNQYKIEETES